MGKNKFIKLLFLLSVAALLVCLLSACGKINTALDDPDYVEVTGLRIDKANVFMAPAGGASTYQLNVEILPSNATNRKLKYFIPSEYLTYVSVDNKGFLTAHADTEGVVVPLTVTSTTNPNAKLTVNIVVEEASVKSIRFKQDKVALLYEGESAVASVDYFPSHATNGRSVEYESLDESVATVAKDANGDAVITPVKAGQTHIKAVAITTDQVESEAFLAVTVDYLQAQYNLRVTGSPQWTQVIGDFSDINFTLDVLGDHIDPNPEIEWYIDTERVLGNSDARQYTHRPNATTRLKYRIGVCIRPYKQDAQWLYSHDITVYNDFVGFELDCQNLSSAYTPYQYGDEADFELLETSSGNTAYYDWYLQKMDGDGSEYKVATTPVDDRNLTKRINVVGDYQLWARAKSDDGTYLKQTLFTFNSERLTVGDVLRVKPEMIEGGLPPDSYHWYYLPCDENGRYNEESLSRKKVISSTAQDEILYYPLKEAGCFRIFATATTNGVLTTVKKNGEKVEYNYISKPIRVYEKGYILEEKAGDLVDFSERSAHSFTVSSVSRVSDVVIEGCAYLNETLLYAHWSPTAGVPRYEAELVFEDGSVVILDSAEKKAVFGSNYLFIPSDVAGFGDKFSLRIKQKDGLFSDYCYYNIPNAKGGGDSTHFLQYSEDLFGYFANFTTNVNGYITTMDEMQGLVEYILLNQPTKDPLVKKGNVTIQEGDVGVLYDTFTVTFFTTLEYTTEMINAYSVDTDEVANEYIDIYTLICGGRQQGGYLSDFKLSVIKEEDGAYTATFSLKNGNKTEKLRSSPSTVRNDDVSSAFYSDAPYNAIDITYPVDRKEGVYVGTSEELAYILERGYRPVPTGSDDLSKLYKQIKADYSSIVDATMSDVEKALAFYDWLCYSVAFDEETTALAATQTVTENYLYESHRLEGIFADKNVKNANNRHAVHDGYAKAFAALCNLAGIPCKTIASKVGTYHVYNKVYLRDAWYVVDVTKGIAKVGESVYADHTCFLMTDSQYSSYCLQRGNRAETYGLHPAANTKYDFFMDATVRGRAVYVTSQAELEELLSAVTNKGTVALELECSSSYCATIDDLRDHATGFMIPSGKYIEEITDIGEGGNVRALILLKDDGN